MCGIAGLFLKNDALQGDLGRMTGAMLRELCDRGPDSAGFAVYGGQAQGTKLCMVSRNGAIDWGAIARRLGDAIGADVAVEEVEDHAIFKTTGAGDIARKWLIDNVPPAYVLSQGQRIEIFKGVGNPAAIMNRLDFEARTGTHAIGHTRMATESAVTVAGSHPFSTGDDTCLVHNGSLSNHNRLREQLVRQGERFQTDNDSEVAAAYLASRMRAGDTLKGALENGLKDLDGFYTFVVGTRDGFAVIRDPIACKPAVIAETDDWVAMASEYRAIAPLPGADNAKIWEPEPATVYAWSRAA
ncbi:MAG: methylamine---glutamate N-methyltransferase subunit [Hyphomicrobiales bacterium]|jgi:amidophosphoribosyltransferase|nr:methylamine---glutamate N-methyltransferase subunit [Hyphomicrobiales bacterium]